MEIIEIPSTVKKASERIVKVADDNGEVDAVYSITFDVRMGRSDYLAVHQALINRETVLLTMDSDSPPNDDIETCEFPHAGRSALSEDWRTKGV